VQMRNITIGGVFHQQVFGADTPGPIWRDAMNGALAGAPSANLPTVSLGDSNHPPSQRNTSPPASDTAGSSPFPGFTLPPSLINGNDTGGNGNRNRKWNWNGGINFPGG
jgi:hypothetical protein